MERSIKMLKNSFVVVAAVLLLVSTANAMIGLEQCYIIGAGNGGGVDGMGMAMSGVVANVKNTQTATEIGCRGVQVGTQEQEGILVEGGTAIGTNHCSSAAYMQCAGAEGSQDLSVTKGSAMADQKTGLCLGQAVCAEKGGAAEAGQGVILGSGQCGGNNKDLVGNSSLIGAVNTSTAIAGSRSEAGAGSLVTLGTNQSSSAK